MMLRASCRRVARVSYPVSSAQRLFSQTLRKFDDKNQTADIEAIETASDGKVKITIKPIPRDNENIEKKRKRLIYQSRKRGILETDLLLSRFANRYIDELSFEELVEYDTLLDEADWDIFYWATKNFDVTPLPAKWKNSTILKRLQDMSENKEREVLRMPNLS